MKVKTESISIEVPGSNTVDGILISPPKPSHAFIFAHGAGAGMAHSFMTAFASGLADRSIATLRFNFPSMQQGGRRPDRPDVAHAAVRAAVGAAAHRFPGLGLIAGGKSFGARMSSQAQATEKMPGVRGLAFVGFPLHPADKPSDTRAEHLAAVDLPMLFLQGTRDALADLTLLRPVVDKLGARATLVLFEDADHSFHVRVRSGQTDAQVIHAMLDAFADWAARLG